MAPKPVDNSVNERRLRPIYDWLDNLNNKKALQEAERVLKKQPNLLCAKALKALAMIRLGKSEEAQHVLKEVHAEEPCEDATLQALAICYRETHRPELTCEAYEAAVRKEPMNEEFLSYLFMSYVRVGDYRKQQQTAMSLFKAKPKNPYYFWAVMSILMQADSNQALSQTVTLPLAERMVKKFVDDGKIEAEAEVQLYLMILEKQKKFQEALELLQGPLSQKHLAAGIIDTKKGDYLRELKQWDRVVDHYEDLLRSDADQWSSYVRYVEAVIAIAIEGSAAVIERAKKFLLDGSQNNNPMVRGPFLARLLFWQELDKNQLNANSLFGNFRDFVEDYVRILGDKPCAFQDLRPFVQCIRSEEEIHALLQCTERLTGLADDKQSPSSVKQICRHLLHIQLGRYLGRHELLSKEEKVRLADSLWVHYEATRFLNDGLLPTDFRSNDGYALLAAHLLLDAWDKEHPDILDKCLVLLETALSQSPANYHLKLLTTRAYMLAGHGQAAVQRYETLDVKYIQLDSLGHLLCRPLISMGLPQSASPILSATLRFYTSHSRETAECLISAYKYGSFGKIPEFTRFGKRLDGSHHFAASTAEQMLLDLLTESKHNQAGLIQVASGMYADSQLDQPNWSTDPAENGCVDNRDCAVFVTWDPPSKQMGEKELIRKTFEGEVAFARLRNRLVHALISTVATSPDWPANDTVLQEVKNGHPHETDGLNGQKKPQSILSDLLDELDKLPQQFEKDGLFIPHSQFSVQSPPPPRLYTYVPDGCLEPLTILMKLVAVEAGNVDESAAVKFQQAVRSLVLKAQAPPDASTGFWRNYVRLERTYNAVETMCLCVLVLSTVHLTVSRSGKKTKVKKKSASHPNDLTEQLKSLIECASKTMKELDGLLDDLIPAWTPSQLQLTGKEDDILEAMKKRMSSAPGAEMRALLNDKRKMLDALSSNL